MLLVCRMYGLSRWFIRNNQVYCVYRNDCCKYLISWIVLKKYLYFFRTEQISQRPHYSLNIYWLIVCSLYLLSNSLTAPLTYYSVFGHSVWQIKSTSRVCCVCLNIFSNRIYWWWSIRGHLSLLAWNLVVWLLEAWKCCISL